MIRYLLKISLLMTAIFALSSCIPLVNIGEPCLNHTDCASLQCHEGYCTKPCNMDLDCGQDLVCLQGLCQNSTSLSYECSKDSECATETCKISQCSAGECIYHPIVCDQPPEDYCNAQNTAYIQFASGACDALTNNCIYQASETDCPDCLTNCDAVCAGSECSAQTDQCLESCTCDPESPDGACTCTEKDDTEATSPQCRKTEEASEDDGYCLAGTCIGCITDDQCEQTTPCVINICNNSECIATIEVPIDAANIGNTTYWQSDSCVDQTPGDCWLPVCGQNDTDINLSGCLQDLVSRTGSNCSPQGEEDNECVAETGTCNEEGNCIAAIVDNGTLCTASGESTECRTASATCNDGVCEQNAVNKLAGAACTDTNSNDCKVAQCDGAGTCNQTYANAVDGTSCELESAGNIPDSANNEDPPSPQEGSELVGTCSSGTCVADGSGEPAECSDDAECKNTTPFCCTTEALTDNANKCGTTNEGTCVACINDDHCTLPRASLCCNGACQDENTLCKAGQSAGRP